MSEEIKFRKMIIKEADREYTKSIGKENFTIRIPLPTEKALMISSTARALGGMPIDSFTPEDVEYIRMIITLNRVVVEYPKWWNGADVCPDDELLFELWSFFIESDKKFSDSLKKNTDGKDLDTESKSD